MNSSEEIQFTFLLDWRLKVMKMITIQSSHRDNLPVIHKNYSKSWWSVLNNTQLDIYRIFKNSFNSSILKLELYEKRIKNTGYKQQIRLFFKSGFVYVDLRNTLSICECLEKPADDQKKNLQF